MDFIATNIAHLTGISLRWVNTIYLKPRRQIAIVCEQQSLLQGVIRGHIEPDTVIHSDGWRGYDGLVDIGFDKHFRVNHSANEFARGEHHINGIESFWSYAKRRLQKFNGVSKHTFYLHLKETEFRFNHRRDNLYLELLRLLKLNPL